VEKNVKQSGGIQYEPVKRVSSKYYRQMTKGILQNNDILINKDGANTGKVGLYLSSHYSKACVNEHLFILRANSEKLGQEYLYYLLLSIYGQKNIKDRISGSAQPGLGKTFLEGFRSLVPSSLSEQCAIVDILTTVDDAIEQTEALIHKYQRIKQGLMQDLLTRGVDANGQLRQLAELAPSLYKQNNEKWIPNEWAIRTIENLSIYVGSGITPKGGSEVYVSEGVMFIRSQNVTFEGLLLNDVAFIDDKIHRSMCRSEIFPFDVLINITGASIGRCCFFPDWQGRANVNQHVCAIRFASPDYYDSNYLSYVLSSWIGQSQIDKLNAGGNRQGLNYQQLRSFQIPWPEKNERKIIVDILKRNDELITIEKNNHLKTIITETRSHARFANR
jgi:type I restriction enzyme S subunit